MKANGQKTFEAASQVTPGQILELNRGGSLQWKVLKVKQLEGGRVRFTAVPIARPPLSNGW